jgi:hypothetical protein
VIARYLRDMRHLANDLSRRERATLIAAGTMGFLFGNFMSPLVGTAHGYIAVGW